MKLINEISLAWKETYLLQPKYFLLTSCVGILGVSLGITSMLFFGDALSSYLNVDPNECIKCQANGVPWIILFITALLLAIYAGLVIVAGTLGTVMYLQGRLTLQELKRYALFSRYPEYWLKKVP